MEDTEQIVIKDFRTIPLSDIEIGESNVRKTQQKAGLEELKASIEKLGLIHPIIVVEGKGGKFTLIVGQRRYLAFQELGRKEIPAIIINRVDPTTEKIVSFGENIHRRKLPYNDTIQVCDELFNNASGEKFERVETIAKTLGISPATVSKYLSYRLVPEDVRKLVSEGKLGANLAYRITSAFWPNTEKITKIAEYMTRMTKSEWERALDIGRKRPEAPVEQIVEEAKKPQTVYELVIPIDSETSELLAKVAKERKTDTITLVRNLIDEFLDSEVK
jgi:ParB family chromosome partitioning protein